MNMTRIKRALSVLLCSVLIAVTALFAAGCTGNNQGTGLPSSSETSSVEKTVVGQGSTVFDFTVYNREGEMTVFEVHTDKTTVGEALVEVKLIAGEDGPYGLYVKTVNGETLDYDKDKMYWSFYIDGAYAMTGVDQTKIEAGKAYAFKAEKG
ncbi:MAG: DUF4430 domain-containing protein [Clostridia bacterium]|nr:DUF4430 domain-containing protein [Clostridia bacterium]